MSTFTILSFNNPFFILMWSLFAMMCYIYIFYCWDKCSYASDNVLSTKVADWHSSPLCCGMPYLPLGWRAPFFVRMSVTVAYSPRDLSLRSLRCWYTCNYLTASNQPPTVHMPLNISTGNSYYSFHGTHCI